MATTNGDISLGGGRIIGVISSDPTALRGEGGWYDPRLVVPLQITMYEQPLEHQIALLRLTASLHLSQRSSPENRFGPEVQLDLLEGFRCRSLPGDPNPCQQELRFNLTQQHVKELEDTRHRAVGNRFSIYIHLKGVVAWLRHTGNSMGNSSTIGEGGWDPNVGMYSELLPFWTTSITALSVDVEPSVWVGRVLPGLGYDRVRLVEVDFSGFPDEGEGVVPAQFDKARQKYDAGDYASCVQECRGIRNAWEKAMGATQNKRITEVLAAKLGWPEKDWHTPMLDSIWKGYGVMVNAAHHPESTPSPVTAADARFCLFLAALLSEYVGRLRTEVVPHS